MNTFDLAKKQEERTRLEVLCEAAGIPFKSILVMYDSEKVPFNWLYMQISSGTSLNNIQENRNENQKFNQGRKN